MLNKLDVEVHVATTHRYVTTRNYIHIYCLPTAPHVFSASVCRLENFGELSAAPFLSAIEL
jgi:hypothetical protein